MDVGYDELKAGFDLLRSAVGLAKDAKDLLPKGSKRDAVTEGLEKAEHATQLAEAQIAQALGYKLCRCTFPPQIMLSIKRPDDRRQYQCSKCGSKQPRDRQFESQSGGTWGRTRGGS